MTAKTPVNDPLARRGPMLVTGLVAATGGVAVMLAAQTGVWRLSRSYGIVFGAVACAEVAALVAVLARPTRRRVVGAVTSAAAVVVLWGLARMTSALPGPDPLMAFDGAIGVTADVCAGLQVTAVALFGGAVVRAGRTDRGLLRFAGAVASAPVIVAVVLASAIGVAGGLASSTAAATAHPRAGDRPLTLEYCQPDGVPLAMDLWRPPATASRPGSPVVVYLHGGGWLGTRGTSGVGATLAGNDGALFTPLQRRLNAAGIAVAAIDYRLAPGAPWPAQLTDAKCAVRFLRARAGALDLDPTRIGAWGSSFGGSLAALLAVTGPDAGFDVGQYSGQSSGVQAVVDMFGAGDLTALDGASPVTRVAVWLLLGDATARRRSASPITYITADAPPFLILHGSRDTNVPPEQSDRLARHLRTAGVTTTLVTVHGAGHGFTAGHDQDPPSSELVSTITHFFVTTLGPTIERPIRGGT